MNRFAALIDSLAFEPRRLAKLNTDGGLLSQYPRP